MVSTRSVKFIPGEKVLCYEPDPAKTKVLYNSKVLDVRVKKAASGKKVAQFLIHFQGWNSTWDRFVTEDYILKDTEDNRKLQRELAEKAQLTASCGNLYRKDRKKRSALTTPTPTTRSRQSSPAKEPTSTVEQSIVNAASSPASSSGAKGAGLKRRQSFTDEGTAVKRRHSITDEGTAVPNNQGSDEHSDNDGGSVPRAPVRSSHFTISSTLRNWLDRDYDRIKVQSKLLKLPADIAAVDVLQKWMIDYTISQMRLMCHKRGHLRPQAGKKGTVVTVDTITRSANLCREVADSLRVYMEFSLNAKMFLYNEEKEQHSHVLRPREPNVNTSRDESPVELDDEYLNHIEDKPGSNDEDGNDGEARRKTLRSHSGGSSNSQEIDTKPDVATLLTNDCLNDGGETLALRPMSIKEKEALKKILSRKLVHDDYKTHKHPSTVYGAVHLARVLVKMPEVLSNAEYGEPKRSLLVEYLNNFMRYLEDHPEWFGESQYIEKPPSTFITSTSSSLRI